MADRLIVELESSETPILEPAKIDPPIRQDYKLEEKPSWKNRRRVIVSSLVFCASTWIWILVGMPLWDFVIAEAIAETALTMSGFLAGSVIGGYVFGAAWSDIGMAKARK